MAIDLKKADVVIIGLGAVGGVAALPLARAGLERGRARSRLLAHAARFCSRRAAQQFPWLAAGGAEGEQRNSDPSAQRFGALFAAAPDPSDDERGRRHLAALLGAELAAQSVGLQSGERDDAALRRRAHAQGFDRRGLAVRAGRARALLRQGRARGRRVRARPATSTAPSIRAAISSRARASATTRCRRCAAPNSPTAWPARRARSAGTPFPGPAAINSTTYDERPGCQYHGFCNRGGCHVSAKNSTAVATIPKAMETKRLDVVPQAVATTIAFDDTSGRVTGVVYVKGGIEYFQPADVVLARELHVRKRAAAAAVEIAGIPEWARQQWRAGRPALLQPPHRQSGDGAVPVRPQQLVRPAGPGRRGRQLGGRQFRSLPASTSSAAAILWVYSDRRPIGAASMSTYGRAPTWGAGVEILHQGER